jgi:hypothetical protein
MHREAYFQGSRVHDYYIPDIQVNSYLHKFTQNPRPFTAYSADIIEAVLKHYNVIPQNAHYARFDVDFNRLIFQVSELKHDKPRWLSKLRGLIRRR